MIRFYIIILCFMLFDCRPTELSNEELEAFVLDAENGLLKTSERNGTKVSITYRPTDFRVYQEIGDKVVSKESIDSLHRSYSNYHYFVLSFSQDGKEALHNGRSASDYSGLLETMSFGMERFVSLTTASNDTIPVGDFMINRTFGFTSSTDLLFAFSKTGSPSSGDWIQFNLNEFGLGTGNQRFRFSTKELEEIPKLKFLTK